MLRRWDGSVCFLHPYRGPRVQAERPMGNAVFKELSALLFVLWVSNFRELGQWGAGLQSHAMKLLSFSKLCLFWRLYVTDCTKSMKVLRIGKGSSTGAIKSDKTGVFFRGKC